jgi:hypothetical protein
LGSSKFGVLAQKYEGRKRKPWKFSVCKEERTMRNWRIHEALGGKQRQKKESNKKKTKR